jgi:hypothetical protein
LRTSVSTMLMHLDRKKAPLHCPTSEWSLHYWNYDWGWTPYCLAWKDSDDGVCCTELLGLFCTLSIVLYVEDKKSHNVSVTGSVSVLTWLRLALSNGPNWVGFSCPIHLRTETDAVSETLWDFMSSTYKTMDKVQNKPNSSVHHTIYRW